MTTENGSHVTPEALAQAHRNSFEKNSQWANYMVDRNIRMYTTDLPRLDGVGFEDVIQQDLEKGDGPVRVLDIGCGAGAFLAGIKAKYPEVEGYGITAFPS